MKIIVIGGAGFIGTNMVLALMDAGYEVIAVDSLSRNGSEKNLAYLGSKFPKLDFRKREIEDVPSLIYQENPELLFHFAAQVAVTSSVESPLRDFKINAEGSFLIAKAAHELGVPVIYTSTNKVYGDNVNRLPIVEMETRYEFDGDLGRRGVDETLSIDTSRHTPYGISKLVGELYVREFGGIANRCSCMYGPNQFGIVDQGWISHIAFNKIIGRPTTIYGDGKQVRDVLHVDDVVRLFMGQARAITGKERDHMAGEVFNIGGGYPNTISLLELCARWDITPKYTDWRPGDQKVFYCDTSKAKQFFGWEPEITLNDGLKELVEWTEKILQGSYG